MCQRWRPKQWRATRHNSGSSRRGNVSGTTRRGWREAALREFCCPEKIVHVPSPRGGAQCLRHARASGRQWHVLRPIRAPLLPRNRTQITVTHDATAGIIVFGCDNLRSGDTFSVRVNGSYLRKMLPSGFPRGASSLHGFFGLLLDGLASEAGLSVADMPGTTLHCTNGW